MDLSNYSEHLSYTQPQIIYKSMISNDLRQDILEYWVQAKESNSCSDNGSVYFPKRHLVRYLPDELETRLKKELVTTMGQYYTIFNPDTSYVRIYYSNYGIKYNYQND